jgi:hypothetical protein
MNWATSEIYAPDGLEGIWTPAKILQKWPQTCSVDERPRTPAYFDALLARS